MALSLYDITVPVMSSAFRRMLLLIEVSRRYAAANGIAEEELLSARLAPDMMNFIAQVQRASDTAKNTVHRLTGDPAPVFPDDERSFDDLLVRIAAIEEYLNGMSIEAFERAESATISLSIGGRQTFTGTSYVLDFALPNFFFHVTTVYDLLRHKGVPVGKLDFLGFR